MFRKIFFIIRAMFFFHLLFSSQIMPVRDAQLSKPWTALRNRLFIFFLTTGSKEQPVISAVCYHHCSLSDNQISICILPWLAAGRAWDAAGREEEPCAASWDEACFTGHLWHFWPAIFSPNNAAGWCYFCSEFWSILFTKRQGSSVSKAFSSCWI